MQRQRLEETKAHLDDIGNKVSIGETETENWFKRNIKIDKKNK